MIFVWIDLETTGHDTPQEGSLLEVAAVTTGTDLVVLHQRADVVAPQYEHVATMPPNVRKMHTQNGLLSDLTPNASSPDELDEDMFWWLSSQLDGDKKPALAGSGVSSYDRKWIDYHLPRTASLLRLWHMDVANVRRFFDMIVADGHPELKRNFKRESGKTHRALDDILDHVDEARLYRDVLVSALHVLGGNSDE